MVFLLRTPAQCRFCLVAPHFQGVGVQADLSTEAQSVVRNCLISGRYFDDLTGFWDSL